MWGLAWRYLARSPRPVVRWLVALSMGGIALSAWAWIVVTSVFNGFSAFLEEVFQRVDPHVRLTGYPLSDSLLQRLRSFAEVEAVAGVYERIGVLKYGQRQAVVRVRFVDDNYPRVSRVGQQLIVGEGFPLENAGALIGAGIATKVALLDPNDLPVWLYVIPSGRKLALTGMEDLPRKRILPQGIFSVQREYDETWVIVHQRDWPQIGGHYTVGEVRLRPGTNPQSFLRLLRRHLPPTIQVSDPRQQHSGLYRVLAQEKALARGGLALLLLLTATGIISTLSTFLLLNRRDWGVYQALGASFRQVEGIITSFCVLLLGIGGGGGTVLGLLTVWSQHQYHWAKLRGGEGFLLQHFPVQIEWGDIGGLFLLLGGILGGLWIYARYQLRQVSLRVALQGD